MLKDEYKVYEDKMKKSIEAVISDFDTVRAGRANASVLNRISVDYYCLLDTSPRSARTACISASFPLLWEASTNFIAVYLPAVLSVFG